MNKKTQKKSPARELYDPTKNRKPYTYAYNEKNAYKIFENIEDAYKNKQITKEQYDEYMKSINKEIKKICEEKSQKFIV